VHFVLRVGQFMIAALCLLAAATFSQADMANGSWPDAARAAPTVSASPAATPADSTEPLELHDGSAADLDGTMVPISSAAPPMPLLSPGEAATTKAVELPSGPDSTGLFLSALGSLGFWQLGRSSKKLHLAHLPEWYHAEGPQQIGHAFALELGLDGSILFDAGDAEVLQDQHAVCRYQWNEPPPRLPVMNHLTPASPRGPPSFPA
jgi:hypothetical protein